MKALKLKAIESFLKIFTFRKTGPLTSSLYPLTAKNAPTSETPNYMRPKRKAEDITTMAESAGTQSKRVRNSESDAEGEIVSEVNSQSYQELIARIRRDKQSTLGPQC